MGLILTYYQWTKATGQTINMQFLCKFFNANTKSSNCVQLFAVAVSHGKGLLATCRGEEGEADIAGFGRGGSPQGGVRARGRPREGGPRLQQVLSDFVSTWVFAANGHNTH